MTTVTDRNVPHDPPTVKSAAIAKAERKTPAAIMKQTVADYLPVIERALPAGMSAERFASTILTAVRKKPELLHCDPVSVISAGIQAAQLGLAPNDGRGLCAIVPYGGKAEFQMEYRGGIELARRSGLVRRVVARTVYEHDEFDYSYGTEDEGLRHTPARTNRGKAILWYAIAWGPDGDLLDFVVLTPEDIEYHRSFSKMKNGQAWTKSYDAMARKTCVWELLRLLPRSVELVSAMDADGHVLGLPAPDAIEPEIEDVGDITPDDDETVSEELLPAEDA